MSSNTPPRMAEPRAQPDAITLAVVSGALTSIVREMSVVIERSFHT